MSYRLRRDDGVEARAESPEEAAGLMRGFEDAEHGRQLGRRYAAQLDRELAAWFKSLGIPSNSFGTSGTEYRRVRMPTHWPLARPEIVRDILKGEDDGSEQADTS